MMGGRCVREGHQTASLPSQNTSVINARKRKAQTLHYSGLPTPPSVRPRYFCRKFRGHVSFLIYSKFDIQDIDRDARYCMH